MIFMNYKFYAVIVITIHTFLCSTYSSTGQSGFAQPEWADGGFELADQSTRLYGESVATNNDGSLVVIADNANAYVYDISEDTTIGLVQKGSPVSITPNQNVSISDDGNILVLTDTSHSSNRGKVKVYSYISGNWLLESTLTGTSANDYFGYSVVINESGDRIAVGATQNNDFWLNEQTYSKSGYVSIFEKVGSSWIKTADFTGSSPKDKFGTSVDFNSAGDVLAIGAHRNDGQAGTSGQTGQVKIFTFNSENSTWTQLGNTLYGSSPDQYFGTSVALDGIGNTLAVGAPKASGNVGICGFVTVFEYDQNNDSWIALSDPIQGDAFYDLSGEAVDLSDDGLRVAIAAQWNDGPFTFWNHMNPPFGTGTTNGKNAGQIRVFDYVDGSWIKNGSDIDGEGHDDYIGNSIALSGDGSRLFIGEHQWDAGLSNGIESVNYIKNKGRARLFEIDTDGDGVRDSYDDDDDGDGTPDVSDAFPLDANETADTDGDGVGDNADAFPSDPSETADTDSDGVGDNTDAYPSDPSETADTDSDGVGDNADAFPSNPSETTDTDGDGVGDNADAFPSDSTETTDTDGDGVGDNSDAYPSDPSESADTDGDGVGDNADAFPNDPTETTDTDGDGIGDNTDTNLFVYTSKYTVPSSTNIGFNDVSVGGDGGGYIYREEARALVEHMLDSTNLGGATITFIAEFDNNTSESYSNHSTYEGANLRKFEATSDTDGNINSYVIIENGGMFNGIHRLDSYWGELNQLSSGDTLYNDLYLDYYTVSGTIDLGYGENTYEIEFSPGRLSFAESIKSTTLSNITPSLVGGATASVGGDIRISLNRGDPTGQGYIDDIYADYTFSMDPSSGTTEIKFLPSFESELPDITTDSDADGTPDIIDLSPNNASESSDSDGDGTLDGADAFQLDTSETSDSDGDGVGDNADTFPNDATETVDSDGDGVGDNGDAFVTNPYESVDSDGDGVGDNTDAFPNDGSETRDYDGDGIGDNADAPVFTDVATYTILDNWSGTVPTGSGVSQLTSYETYTEEAAKFTTISPSTGAYDGGTGGILFYSTFELTPNATIRLTVPGSGEAESDMFFNLTSINFDGFQGGYGETNPYDDMIAYNYSSYGLYDDGAVIIRDSNGGFQILNNENARGSTSFNLQGVKWVEFTSVGAKVLMRNISFTTVTPKFVYTSKYTVPSSTNIGFNDVSVGGDGGGYIYREEARALVEHMLDSTNLGGATITFIAEFDNNTSESYSNHSTYEGANLRKFEATSDTDGNINSYVIIENGGMFNGIHRLDSYWGELNQLSSGDTLYNDLYLDYYTVSGTIDLGYGENTYEIEFSPGRLSFAESIKSTTLSNITPSLVGGATASVGGDIRISLNRGDPTGQGYIDDIYADYTFSMDPSSGTTEIKFLPSFESELPDITTDSDADGTPDIIDLSPNNASESSDSDGDGTLDGADAFQLDTSETSDSDGDGVGDNADTFPNDATETVDSDGDGVGDNGDAFVTNPYESVDSDGDGVGDNTDAFPNDGSETRDYDGDGIGDNADAPVFTDVATYTILDNWSGTVPTGSGVSQLTSYETYTEEAAKFTTISPSTGAYDGGTGGILFYSTFELTPNATIRLTVPGSGEAESDMFFNLTSINFDGFQGGYGETNPYDDMIAYNYSSYGLYDDGAVIIRDSNGGFQILNNENARGSTSFNLQGVKWVEFTSVGAKVLMRNISFTTVTPDTDGDGVDNNVDAFPSDPSETNDTDSDGVGDNTDAFPSDPSESADTDGDGVGDNGDVHPGYNDEELTTYLSNNNYAKTSEIIDARAGSTLITVSNGVATVELKMEQSDDLQTWSEIDGSTSMDIPADASVKFFRFKMAD